MNEINWQKVNGLLPVIVQDSDTLQVLMLGYMNEEALQKTQATQQVTFYSRTKQRLWTKGETSGNVLQLVDMHLDCDQDTLLVYAQPIGPTCHLGTTTCFGEQPRPDVHVLGQLLKVIEDRYQHPTPNSSTASLFDAGVARMAQKVGEEGVEVALAAATNDLKGLTGEAADLLFHLLVLLRGVNLPLQDVLVELQKRMKS